MKTKGGANNDRKGDGNGKDGPRGRRKLEFVGQQKKQPPKPLTNKKIYLHLKGLRKVKELEDNLKFLGAVVEEAFSKDIDYLISNNDEARVRRDRNHGSPAMSTPSPFQLGQGINSPQHDSPGNTEGKSNSVATRGQSIFQKARLTQTHGTCNVIDNARKFNIKVIHIDTVQKWLRTQKEKCPEMNQPKSQQTKAPSKSSLMKNKTLKSPFVKFESINRQYKPIHQEFDSLPVLSVLTPRGTCPFDTRPAGRGIGGAVEQEEERGERGEVEERDDLEGRAGADRSRPVSTAVNKRPSTGQPRPGTHLSEVPDHGRLVTAGELRRMQRLKKAAERKKGYCECCGIKYDDLEKHIKTDSHKKFVQKQENFKALDKLICQGPSMKRFLNDVLRYHTIHVEEGKKESKQAELRDNNDELQLVSELTPQKPRLTSSQSQKPTGSKSSAKSLVKEYDSKKVESVNRTRNHNNKVRNSPLRQKSKIGNNSNFTSKKNVEILVEEVGVELQKRDSARNSDSLPPGGTTGMTLKAADVPCKDIKQETPLEELLQCGPPETNVGNNEVLHKHPTRGSPVKKEDVNSKSVIQPKESLPRSPVRIMSPRKCKKSTDQANPSIKQPKRKLPDPPEKEAQANPSLKQPKRKLPDPPEKGAQANPSLKQQKRKLPDSPEKGAQAKIKKTEVLESDSKKGTISSKRAPETKGVGSGAENAKASPSKKHSRTTQNTTVPTQLLSPKRSRTRIVKLNQKWTVLSPRCTQKLFESEADPVPFTGFTTYASNLPHGTSYIDISEIELEDNSEMEWEFQEFISPTKGVLQDLTQKLELEKQQDLSEASSKWDDTLDEYLHDYFSQNVNKPSPVYYQLGVKGDPLMNTQETSRVGIKQGIAGMNSYMQPQAVSVEPESDSAPKLGELFAELEPVARVGVTKSPDFDEKVVKKKPIRECQVRTVENKQNLKKDAVSRGKKSAANKAVAVVAPSTVPSGKAKAISKVELPVVPGNKTEAPCDKNARQNITNDIKKEAKKMPVPGNKTDAPCDKKARLNISNDIKKEAKKMPVPGYKTDVPCDKKEAKKKSVSETEMLDIKPVMGSTPVHSIIAPSTPTKRRAATVGDKLSVTGTNLSDKLSVSGTSTGTAETTTKPGAAKGDIVIIDEDVSFNLSSPNKGKRVFSPLRGKQLFANTYQQQPAKAKSKLNLGSPSTTARKSSKISLSLESIKKKALSPSTDSSVGKKLFKHTSKVSKAVRLDHIPYLNNTRGDKARQKRERKRLAKSLSGLSSPRSTSSQLSQTQLSSQLSSPVTFNPALRSPDDASKPYKSKYSQNLLKGRHVVDLGTESQDDDDFVSDSKSKSVFTRTTRTMAQNDPPPKKSQKLGSPDNPVLPKARINRTICTTPTTGSKSAAIAGSRSMLSRGKGGRRASPRKKSLSLSTKRPFLERMQMLPADVYDPSYSDPTDPYEYPAP